MGSCKKVLCLEMVFIFLTVILISPFCLASYNVDNLKIPDVIIEISSGTGAVIVEKQTQQLFFYKYNNGKYKRIYNMKCSTGEVNGSKMLAGDKKTPEGIYFFINDYIDKYLSPIYGARALPIDYPNFIDKKIGKNGNSIWLHGTNKPLKDRSSNGCIVLNNPDIEKLAKHITLNRTPIIIVDKISYISTELLSETKQRLIDCTKKWVNALQEGTYQDYLFFYDYEYVPDISWWQDWIKLRQNLNDFKVKIKQTDLYKHDDIYVSIFDQFLSNGYHDEYIGTMKLFLKERENRLKIVGQKYQKVHKFEQIVKQGYPLINSAYSLRYRVDSENDIVKLIDGWLKAWSSGNIDQYGRYYSNNFRSKGMNLKRWLNYKNYLNEKYDYINVSKDNLYIKHKKGANKSTVVFTQKYVSSGYNAIGTKKLVLIKEGGEWKIYREIWRKN